MVVGKKKIPFEIFHRKPCVGKVRGLVLIMYITYTVIYLYPKPFPPILRKFRDFFSVFVFAHSQKPSFWAAFFFQLEVKTTVYKKQKRKRCSTNRFAFQRFRDNKPLH